MKTKLNSYQKQKEKIKELEKEIYNLVFKRYEEQGIQTELKYRIINQIEEQIWLS